MPGVTSVLHHHVGREGPFEKGLNVTSTRAAFEAQIDWLAARYDVIDLGTLLEGALPRRPLLLTFDDAFRSSFEVIRDVLAPRGLPSVFFINPGLLEERAISLDSALAWAAARSSVKEVCRLLGLPERETVGQVVVGDMAGYSAARRLEHRDRLLDAFGPPDFAQRAPLIGPGEVAELADLGAEIGNHTMHHVHGRSLTAAELKSEVIDAKTRLERLSGRAVRSFSVPYGHEDDLTPALLDTLRASGHRAIFLVHARANIRRPAPDIWYRVSLHDEPPRRLRRELVYKPLLRTIRHLAANRG